MFNDKNFKEYKRNAIHGVLFTLWTWEYDSTGSIKSQSVVTLYGDEPYKWFFLMWETKESMSWKDSLESLVVCLHC